LEEKKKITEGKRKKRKRDFPFLRSSVFEGGKKQKGKKEKKKGVGGGEKKETVWTGVSISSPALSMGGKKGGNGGGKEKM